MLVFISFLLLTFKLSQYSDALNLISYGFNVKKKNICLQMCERFNFYSLNLQLLRRKRERVQI